MAHQIFISYPSENKQPANDLCQALEASGLSCWMAPRDITPGSTYSKAIINAIRDSRMLLLVYSRYSNKSDHVLREIERAANHRIPILSFRIDDAELSEDLEYFLSTPQWLDACVQPMEQHYKTAVTASRRLLGESIDNVESDLTPNLEKVGVFTATATKSRSPRWFLGAGLGAILVALVLLAGWWLQRQSEYYNPALLNAALTQIKANSTAMDARLDFVAQALSKDEFSEKIKAVRNKIAPDLAPGMSDGYLQIVAEANLASLRQAINSSPLSKELSGGANDALISAGVEDHLLKSYAENLLNVQWSTESLFNTMTALAKVGRAEIEQHRRVNRQRLKHAQAMVENYSQIAHASGLGVLVAVDLDQALSKNIKKSFKQLLYLQPRSVVSVAELQQYQEKLLDRQLALSLQRAELVKKGKDGRDEQLEELDKLNQQLIVQATDSQSLVIGKALSLRQLGRTKDAVLAFARYAVMFAESDPKVKRYAETAQHFSLQLKELGVQGGVYLYSVTDGSIAQKAGLQVGDIVVEYGGQTIADMDSFAQALAGLPHGEQMRVEFLRVDAQGKIVRKFTTVTCCPLGVGYMPI